MNNPTPKKTKTKVDTFEDTLFLMDLYKHKMQLAKYEKRVFLNRNFILFKTIFYFFIGENDPGYGNGTEKKERASQG